MRPPLSRIWVFAFSVGSFPPGSVFGQELPRLGVGAKVSTLGIGIEAATAVTQHSNVRGGFNFYDYKDGASKDGIHYDAALTLRSLQVTYDQYIASGFHVSPGL